MANHSEHEFLAQAINIPRHVKKLLIFNSHYFHVKLLFKVKKKFWNGPDSQQNGYLLYTDITEICMCNNYAREVVCGTGTLVLGTFPQECKSSVRVHKRLIHDKVIMPPQYLEYEEYWPRLCQGHKP